jgi:hypothetical protein
MNKERLRYWLCAGAALVAGLLLRLWFISHMARVAGDSLIYGDIAKTLIQHRVYGFTDAALTPGSIKLRPTLIRLPGYPLFLAACFRLFGMEHYRAVMNLQVAADLLTCWLASALAGRLFGARSALVVLWLAALCPFTANYVAAPLTETLVLTTIALTFYGFRRWEEAGCGYNRWLWSIVAALAVSVLLRPEQGLFVAGVLLAMLWRLLATRNRCDPAFRAALPVLVAALCVILPLLPWTIRNWSTFHVFQPLAPRYANDPGEMPPLGFSRWYRTWAIDFCSTEDVYWNLNGDRIELDDLPSRAFAAGSPSASEDLHRRTAALLASYNVTTTLTPQIDARFSALGRERIRIHPVLYYAALPVARLLDMTLRPRTELMDIPLDWWKWREHPRQTAFSAAYATLNLAYIALGIAGLWGWVRRGRQSALPVAPNTNTFQALAFAMAASVILRSALLLTLDNSEMRYTLEFFPLLFVWSGALFVKPSSSNDDQATPATLIERAVERNE